jgi:hypothetical protein
MIMRPNDRILIARRFPIRFITKSLAKNGFSTIIEQNRNFAIFGRFIRRRKSQRHSQPIGATPLSSAHFAIFGNGRCFCQIRLGGGHRQRRQRRLWELRLGFDLRMILDCCTERAMRAISFSMLIGEFKSKESFSLRSARGFQVEERASQRGM